MRKKKEENYSWRTRPVYKGLDLKKIATRPGCLDILAHPSRIENTYFYPDGRIEVHNV
jgi:hypothetical protein